MKKELRGYISRVRKAQDYIHNGKAGERVAIDLSMGTGDYIWIGAYRHCADTCEVEESERLCIYSHTTPQEISEGLSMLSKVVGFDI